MGNKNSDLYPKYVMHPLIVDAYCSTHDWFKKIPEMEGYENLTYSDDGQKVLKRENYRDAAFNF